MTPIFSVLYTSRRPHAIGPVCDEWRGAARHKDAIEWIVTVDGDDPQSLEAAQNVPYAAVGVQNDLPGDCTKGWNLAATMSSGRILIAISDDFEPITHWDQQILDKGPNPNWLDEPWVMLVHDGICDLCTLPIVTRPWYNDRGYIYHPDYVSMFNDNELTDHARMLNQLVVRKELVFRHVHWVNALRTRDKYDEKHSSQDRFRTSKELYTRRRLLGFPKITPPEGVIMTNKRIYSQSSEETDVLEAVAGLPTVRVLDIGAYDGHTFSNTRAAIESKPGSTGVMVEACPSAFVRLIGTYETSPEVQLINAVILPETPTEALIPWYWSHGDMVSSHLTEHRDKWEPRLPEKMVPMWVHPMGIDDLIHTFPGPFDVISIDVEGSSAAIFFKLPDSFLKEARVIVVEVDDQGEAMAERMKPLGFYARFTAENIILIRGVIV